MTWKKQKIPVDTDHGFSRCMFACSQQEHARRQAMALKIKCAVSACNCPLTSERPVTVGFDVLKLEHC